MGGRSPVQQAGRRDRVRVDDSLHDRLGGEELFNDGRLRGVPPAPPSASPPPPHEWGGALSIYLSLFRGFQVVQTKAGGGVFVELAVQLAAVGAPVVLANETFVPHRLPDHSRLLDEALLLA